MAANAPSSGRLRFDDIEVDLRSAELWVRGRRTRLQEQPFQVLRVLLERRGELVTRDELKQTLWSADTFVDFDDGLNTAVRKIREALGDAAEKPRYVETIPRHGYRFVGHLIEPATAAPPAPAAPLPSPVPVEEPKGREPDTTSVVTPGAGAVNQEHVFSTRRWAWLAGLAALAVVSVALVLYRGSLKGATKPPIRSLAVLPFKNFSADSTQDYLADGMTEALISRLAGIHNLRVISRTSISRFKNTSLSVPQIANALGVDAIVEGSVVREGDSIRVYAQLIRATNEENVWSETYDRALRDVLSLQSDVAQAVAQRVETTITREEHARLSSARTVDPDAYEAYLKGRYYWNKRTAEGMQKAARYFEQAISKDPGYDAAYSGLADCNSGLAWHGFMSPAEVLPRASAAGQKAIELEPQSAEAHASLALALDHKWDWVGAEAEFRRALELNPQYANAHHWYGDYLSIRGRHADAELEAKRALELDPLNLMIGTWLSLRYYLARRYDAAMEQARNTVDLDPTFAAAHLILGETYAQQGKHQEGLEELRNAARLSGGSPLYTAQVGVSLALAGDRPGALGVIRELRDMSAERYVSPYGVAQIYAALKDKEQTYAWLEAAYRDRAVWMSYLAVDPLFDAIRSEPRFQDLVHRVGLD